MQHMETRQEKQALRTYWADLLANAAPVDGENANGLLALYETLVATVIMYCEPGDTRTSALSQLASSYTWATKALDRTPIDHG